MAKAFNIYAVMLNAIVEPLCGIKNIYELQRQLDELADYDGFYPEIAGGVKRAQRYIEMTLSLAKKGEGWDDDKN